MSRKDLSSTALLALLIAACATAYAAEDVAPGQPDKNGVVQKPVYADTPETFAEQSRRIVAEMQQAGRYEYISATDKRTVERLLEQMGNLLQSSGSVAAMNNPTRLQLFNAQEEVNGILKHNDSNRLVCESRAPIGSNILRTTCRTHGQIEATARNTQAGMQEYDHSRLCNSGSMETPCQANMNPGRPVSRGGR